MQNNNFWRGRRVFLTGHTGFKGSWLLTWLLEMGAEIYCYSKAPEGDRNLYRDLFCKSKSPKNFSEIYGDIRDCDKLSKYIKEANPEIVFHLAAQPLVRESYENPIYTWEVNVQGSLILLDCLKLLNEKCSVVMVTTDKVYLNQEWKHGYRETDILGGYDPYSASKAAAEIAIASWRSSFCGKLSHQKSNLNIATARAGNVIGGGDWANDRIVPDCIKALITGELIRVRNPFSTRPWQHVLEPLSGYLRLAECLHKLDEPICEAFNFGPSLESNRTVQELVENIVSIWPGKWEKDNNNESVHEANLLHLQIDKSFHILGWSPKWKFNEVVSRSVEWYKSFNEGASAMDLCLDDISNYQLK